jgi:hypothetical protein
MDKSKLPKMTKKSTTIRTKPGAVDDNAKIRMKRNLARRKRILDQLK